MEEILGIWPAELHSRLLLISFFVKQPALSFEARTLLNRGWDVLLSSESPPSVGQGSFYVQHLLRISPQKARDTWIQLLRSNGVVDFDYETLRNQVWNGQFETEPSFGPLD